MQAPIGNKTYRFIVTVRLPCDYLAKEKYCILWL